MKWRKLKHLFVPDNNYDWMVSHAANPFPIRLDKSIYRVFFTCRNAQNQSYIAYVDIDFENDYKVVNISKKPVLSPGVIGSFDDSGVAMGSLIEVNGKQYLYYLGWNLKVTVPWLNTIGLAILNTESNEFEKFSRAPIMDRSDEDPYSISYPSILFESAVYKMWYGSNLSWGKDQKDMKHVIKFAESTNGINWQRTNDIHINLFHPNEFAISKPFVIKDGVIYKMWYSYRANGSIDTYRIGYAESIDGLIWERMDENSGIDVAEEGWDSEMIEYPAIVDFNGSRYMLYNGNGYGKTGFGLAVLET